jgi:hypothetical protein
MTPVMVMTPWLGQKRIGPRLVTSKPVTREARIATEASAEIVTAMTEEALATSCETVPANGYGRCRHGCRFFCPRKTRCRIDERIDPRLVPSLPSTSSPPSSPTVAPTSSTLEATRETRRDGAGRNRHGSSLNLLHVEVHVLRALSLRFRDCNGLRCYSRGAIVVTECAERDSVVCELSHVGLVQERSVHLLHLIGRHARIERCGLVRRRHARDLDLLERERAITR